METKTKVLIGLGVGLGIALLGFVAYKMISPKKQKSNADGKSDGATDGDEIGGGYAAFGGRGGMRSGGGRGGVRSGGLRPAPHHGGIRRRIGGGGYRWNGMYWVDVSGVCYTKTADGEYIINDCDAPINPLN
jgi:hypothetical protein